MASRELKKNGAYFNELMDKRKKEMDELTAKLEQGVKAVFEGTEYMKLLKVMANLPSYSINNQLLIMMQRPDATICNSYTGWQKMNRHVRKGEQGIRIMAPAPYKIEAEQNKLDANGNQIYGPDGQPVKEKVDVMINAYKPVTTFAYEQTDGEPLPSIVVDELKGTLDNYEILLEAIKKAAPVPIEFKDINNGAKGYYHLNDKKIVIQSGMSNVQTIKTAIHEVAHAKYHSLEMIKELDKPKSKEQKETEAESIAFVCCAHFGIETGDDYSFGYVASYATGKDTPELKESLQLIRQGACEILDEIEAAMKELSKDQEPDIEADEVVDDDVPFKP